MHDENVRKGVLVLDTIIFPRNVNEVEKGQGIKLLSPTLSLDTETENLHFITIAALIIDSSRVCALSYSESSTSCSFNPELSQDSYASLLQVTTLKDFLS